MQIDPDLMYERISEDGWHFEPAAANALYLVPPANDPSRNYATRWTPITLLLPEYMNASSEEESVLIEVAPASEEEGCCINGKVRFQNTSTLSFKEVQALERFKEIAPATFAAIIESCDKKESLTTLLDTIRTSYEC